MSSPPVYSPRAIAMAAFALAIGGFGIGTGEFAIMGLLPNVAEHLHVSAPEVGHLISAYALGVVIGAPLIAVMAAHLSRSTLLFGLMIWFVIGNFASAFAPGYYSLMAFRFLTGMPHGAYFGVAALVAASMVPPHRRGQAIGRVMLGLTVAALIGNPLATGLGQWLGWRAAFAAVGTIGIITLIMLNKFVPHQEDQPVSSARQELGALRRGQVWFTLGIGAIGFGGLFAVFSYIAPTLTQVTGLGESWVPIALAVMGAGMIAGNIAGGWLADRALVKSIGGVLVWTMLVLAIFPWMAGNTWTMMLNIFLIGTGLALGPVLQIRLMDVAADAQTLAASLNHSAFNMANALGAWLGGVAITAGYGWTSTGWVGAMLALAGLLLFGLSLLHMRRMGTVSGAA
ncbi:MFS transporter [Pigmentiphaga litoralis]|uniref:DHA1 family inner membrane transport protein n=1 Tax=Pigmentiphaga litoralis TaxID=516702 RepID=A0A7Y9IW67_9BURK|nr:MFS transporter [Pigmentiphaga litoralis]NYE22767.1 DHA1 family inner membrane transport protein [Pigmentiphaga litoralis]NYE83618.1 DHA1 family inner membrane transport protein [Pigmentiphaga litoralis]